jgi:hypothetical protein
MTTAQMMVVLERKRAVHPELRKPLDWKGARAVLAREGVLFATAPIAHAARLTQIDGAWTVLVSTRVHPRRYTYYAAHELAHLWLHVDRAGIERWEEVYNYDDGGDPEQEDDAEWLATAMLYAVE